MADLEYQIHLSYESGLLGTKLKKNHKFNRTKYILKLVYSQEYRLILTFLIITCVFLILWNVSKLSYKFCDMFHQEPSPI